jgi:hypothetical protein
LDVERAQRHYRDALGSEIGGLYPDKELRAVSKAATAAGELVRLDANQVEYVAQHRLTRWQSEPLASQRTAKAVTKGEL